MFIKRNRKKWLATPSGKRVNSTRPQESRGLSGNTQPTDRPKPTIARFLLDGPVLPLVTQTLPVAEAFRRALMGQYQRCLHRRKYGRARKPYQESFRSELLSGKDADGRLLRAHRHAYYLPTAEGGDGRWITHVTVAAAGGFGRDELSALNALRRLLVADESAELRLQLIGLGQPRDFRALLVSEATVWQSATPFVATRYPKLRGRKRDVPESYASPGVFAAHVLREELHRRGDLPPIAAIEEEESFGGQRFRSLQFERIRTKPGDDGGRRPSGVFRIRFTSPVFGPVCVGHSCHFGLGLFLPSSFASERAAR